MQELYRNNAIRWHVCSGIGERCSQSEECGHVHGAVCTDQGVCNCAEKTVMNGQGKECLPVASEILDGCLENIQCNVTFPNALCIDRSCQCQNRYHFEPEMNRCFIDRSTYSLLLSSYSSPIRRLYTVSQVSGKIAETSTSVIKWKMETRQRKRWRAKRISACAPRTIPGKRRDA